MMGKVKKTTKARAKTSGAGRGRRRTRARESAAVSSEDRNFKQEMLSAMAAIGYDGNFFADMLEKSTSDRVKEGKLPRKNRYYHYCSWAHALMRNEVGPENAEYAFPAEVLSFIRHLVPGDIKGEIRKDAFQVSLKDFCRVMEMREMQS